MQNDGDLKYLYTKTEVLLIQIINFVDVEILSLLMQ